MNNAGRGDKSDELEAAVDHMMQKTKDLRRQLCKAVIDHISDSFLDTNVPILVLIEAAQSGDEKQVKEYAQVNMKLGLKRLWVICLRDCL